MQLAHAVPDHRLAHDVRDAPRIGDCVEPGERERLEMEVEEEIADAFAFAEASPFPQAAELTSDVFKEE